jgi:succinate dehydrogenase/fumarate reductase flavoprotein subunit
MSKKESTETGSKLSRRDFLKGASVAGVAAATLTLSGCNEQTASEDFWIPEKWDYESEVVLIGYGGAGASAAIQAADEGAKVLVLEKVTTEGGGSSRMSMGFLWWASDVEKGGRHLAALSGGTTSLEVGKAYCQQAMGLKDWIESMGLEVTNVSDNPSPEYPVIADSDSVRGGNIPGMGQVLWEALDREVKARDGVEVLFDCTAHDLIQNPKTREIIGVKATLAGQEVNIKASKAVALTCGGFMYNDEMLRNFLRLYPFISYSWRYNTGDGIKMAQKVGAALWHTNFIAGRGTPWFADLEPAVGGFPGGSPRKPNYIVVDKYGKRYLNEKGYPPHGILLNMGDYDARACEYTRVPSLLIFDETARAAGALCTEAGGCFIPKELGGHDAWSKDNMAEIEKGWIKKADTIEELAAELNKSTPTYEKLGIFPKLDAATLKASVDRYNGFCALGVDEDFNTPAASLAPIETPPFYGMPLWPGCSDNPGGPKRNEFAQVVDPDDKPIPRLYEAGSCGAITGLLYVRGGCYLSDALVFGQIAALNMVKETPWDA